MQNEKRLRIGVMLDRLSAEAWIDELLRRVDELPYAELALVVLDGTAARPRGNTYWRLRRHLLYYAYEKLDRRLFARRDPFRLVDLAPRLDGVPRLVATPVTRGFEQRFDDESLRAIADHDLDVLLRFGFRIIRGGILDAARYGVWSYHHGDNRRYRGGPSHFWEMAEGAPTTGAILQLLTDDLDAGLVLRRSSTATDTTSLQRGREKSFWKATAFVPRMLAELHRLGPAALDAAEPAATGAPIYRLPANGRMLRFLAALAVRLARQTVQRRRPLDWFVGYRRREADTWRMLDAPPDRFYADPFPFEREGVSYLFFEDYDYRAGAAVISVVELADDGTPGAARVALDTGHHLSYPFVFEHEGEVFLLPEAVESSEVRLYRATRFPDRWEVHAVLLAARGADPTLVRHDGRFWLFVNVPEEGAAYEDELSLYVADRLDGPWTPHPRSPVVSDVRGARGAGRVFERDGLLLRPGQDAATEELAVVLHRIDRLTSEDYAEHPVERFDRSWHPDAVGAHTYNESEHWVAVDGYRRPLKLRWTRRVR